MGSSSGSKRRRGADDAASSERNKTLHSSFATAANAVAGLYSAASAAQKSASAAGAKAVLVSRQRPEGWGRERGRLAAKPFFFLKRASAKRARDLRRRRLHPFSSPLESRSAPSLASSSFPEDARASRFASDAVGEEKRGQEPGE